MFFYLQRHHHIGHNANAGKVKVHTIVINYTPKDFSVLDSVPWYGIISHKEERAINRLRRIKKEFHSLKDKPQCGIHRLQSGHPTL